MDIRLQFRSPCQQWLLFSALPLTLLAAGPKLSAQPTSHAIEALVERINSVDEALEAYAAERLSIMGKENLRFDEAESVDFHFASTAQTALRANYQRLILIRIVLLLYESAECQSDRDRALLAYSILAEAMRDNVVRFFAEGGILERLMDEARTSQLRNLYREAGVVFEALGRQFESME